MLVNVKSGSSLRFGDAEAQYPSLLSLLVGEAFRERPGDVAGGRGRDGSAPGFLFAEIVDACGKLLTGNVPVRDARVRKTPSLSRFKIGGDRLLI